MIMEPRMNYKKLQLNIFALLIIMIGFLIRISTKYFLDKKYFYDTNFILYAAHNNVYTSDKSYNFTSNFFSILNLDLDFWYIVLFIVTGLIIYLFIIRYEPIYNKSIFLLLFPMQIGIFYVYNSTVSKDFIQFLIYDLLLMCFILFKKKYVYIVIPLVVLFSSLFRSYLIFEILFYFLLLYILNGNTNIKIVKRLIFVIIIVIVSLSIFHKINPELVNNLINVRMSLNSDRINDPDARTVILDLINNNNNDIYIWLMNYLIDIIRLFFPFELIKLFSIKYFFFIIYQIIVSLLLFKNLFSIKYIDGSDKKILLFTFSIFLTNMLFEPDFGSFVKHQTAYLLFIYWSLFRARSSILINENYKGD